MITDTNILKHLFLLNVSFYWASFAVFCAHQINKILTTTAALSAEYPSNFSAFKKHLLGVFFICGNNFLDNSSQIPIFDDEFKNIIHVPERTKKYWKKPNVK